MLLDCYRNYIGDLKQVSEMDVVVGMGLTVGGILLSVLGWIVFLWNETGPYGTAGFYAVRELTIAAAGLGVPLLLLGVVTMLMGNDRITVVSIAGFAVCLAANLFFVATYPSNWNVASQFNAPIGVSLFGIGLAMMLFATGAAWSCRVTERPRLSGEPTG